MNYYETLLGKGAASAYEAAGANIRTWRGGTKGLVSYGDGDYMVIRHNLRKWEVSNDDGQTWWFGSQWELLAWFGDRL